MRRPRWAGKDWPDWDQSLESAACPALIVAVTHALLARGCQVLAIELDRDMVRVLEEELGGHPALEVRQGDAAGVDLESHSATCGEKLVVTGNLPYQATGAILRQVVKHHPVLSGAILMVLLLTWD